MVEAADPGGNSIGVGWGEPANPNNSVQLRWASRAQPNLRDSKPCTLNLEPCTVRVSELGNTLLLGEKVPGGRMRGDPGGTGSWRTRRQKSEGRRQKEFPASLVVENPLTRPLATLPESHCVRLPPLEREINT